MIIENYAKKHGKNENISKREKEKIGPGKMREMGKTGKPEKWENGQHGKTEKRDWN